ncbi:MAG: selenocysteine-specific translation factor, partial [Comamonadaceae bacterium]
PVLGVSALSGEGLPALHDALARAAERRGPRPPDERSFRFVVDRSFSATGSGTVVTGTVLDGQVAVGDRLTVSPAGLAVRVRGLHQRGGAVERAGPGERCALNIAGADPAQAARGTWLLAPNAHAPTQRLDVQLRLLAGERKPLKHWDTVHLHIGTLATMARLVMPGQALPPGAEACAQLLLDKPVAAALGDRFVLRDASAQHTIGGGAVLDPFGRPPRGRQASRGARLAALQQRDPGQALATLLRQGTGVAVQDFRRTYNLAPAAMRALLEGAGALLPGGDQGSAFDAAGLRSMQDAILETLRGFHAASPQAAGMDTDRLLRAACPALRQREAIAILRGMADAASVALRGSLVHLPHHVVVAPPGDERLWRQLSPLYAQWGAQVPLLREVAARSGIDEARLRDVLKHRVVTGEVLRVATDRFLPRAVVAGLAEAVLVLARGGSGDGFTIAQYRDATGIGRNLAIEVLEFFDRLGLTRRGGDARVIRCLDADVAAAIRDPAWRARA